MRTGYTMTYRVGSIQAGEIDQLWTPRKSNGKPGVMLLHGATAPQAFAEATRASSAMVGPALSSRGYSAVAGTMGGDTFANDTAMARMTAAGALLGATFHLLGFSMGFALALRYAAANPGKVASLVGVIPLSDILTMYANNTAGLAASIAAAWGVPNGNPLPAGADLSTGFATIAAAGIPARLYYSNPDTSIPPASVLATGAAINADIVAPVNGGHTEAGIGQIGAIGAGGWSDVGNWLDAL